MRYQVSVYASDRKRGRAYITGNYVTRAQLVGSGRAAKRKGVRGKGEEEEVAFTLDDWHACVDQSRDEL